MSHPYQLLFRTPAVRRAYLSVLLSAIPLGTITLGLVLSVQAWTGSLTVAGSITAFFTVGNAIGLTVQGALIDRIDDRAVVAVAGLVSGLTLTTISVLGSDQGRGLLTGLALLAGLSVPAITTAVRRLVPALIDETTTRSAGYAVLSVVFQLAFAVGPLLVSVTVVITGHASAALLVSAAMIITATIVFSVALPSARTARPAGRMPDHRQLTVLRPLLTLYGVAALTGVATGMMTIAIPAVTQAAGVAALAGVAFAAGAIGDVIGAVVFGSRRWPLAERQQLTVALLAASGVAAVVFCSSGTLWLLVLAVALGGAVGAPIAIRLSSLLDQVTRPEALGLAYAVLVSVGLVAAALGTTIAGHLSEATAPRLLLLGPPLTLLVAAALAHRTKNQ